MTVPTRTVLYGHSEADTKYTDYTKTLKLHAHMTATKTTELQKRRVHMIVPTHMVWSLRRSYTMYRLH